MSIWDGCYGCVRGLINGLGEKTQGWVKCPNGVSADNSISCDWVMLLCGLKAPIIYMGVSYIFY